MIRFSSVTYTYPHASSPAVREISLSVNKGNLVLCTGPSGCGKSTLVRLANGLIPHYLRGHLTGNVFVDGHDTLARTPASLAVEVGTLFQDPEQQFFALTVRDEMAIALEWRKWSPSSVQVAVESAAEKLGISALLPQTIFGLSEGQKQKVALASLLAGNPKALVLDEPSANLDPESAEGLAVLLQELKQDGLAVFVVDHRLAWLRHIADSLVVLDSGSIVFQGGYQALDDPAFCSQYGLRAAFVEDGRKSLPDLHSAPQAESVFCCDGLNFSYSKENPLISGFSFGFSEGEVTALIGPNGVGKTTLARLFTGLEKSGRGQFFAFGEKVAWRKLPLHAQVVLQNAGHQLRMRTVEAELMDAACARGEVQKDLQSRVEKMLNLFGLGSVRNRHPQSLSGGEKQRLAIACAAVRSPRMLILDEPTSGLDGRNMLRVAASVREAADSGAAVLVITHDLELMSEVCRSKLVLPLANVNGKSCVEGYSLSNS